VVNKGYKETKRENSHRQHVHRRGNGFFAALKRLWGSPKGGNYFGSHAWYDEKEGTNLSSTGAATTYRIVEREDI